MPPGLDQNFCLPQAVEDLAVKQFIPQLAVEAFAIAVLPRAAWLDVSRLRADIGNSPA
jgi:hypothetical protein